MNEKSRTVAEQEQFTERIASLQQQMTEQGVSGSVYGQAARETYIREQLADGSGTEGGRTVAEQQQSIVDGLRAYERLSDAAREVYETEKRLAEGRRLVADMRRWMDAGSATLADMMAQGADEANRTAREELARRISGATGTTAPHALTGFAAGRVFSTGCLTERLFTRSEVLSVLRAQRAAVFRGAASGDYRSGHDDAHTELIGIFERME